MQQMLHASNGRTGYIFMFMAKYLSLQNATPILLGGNNVSVHKAHN